MGQGNHISTDPRPSKRSKTLQAAALSIKLNTFQSNHEGELVERIHRARDEKVDAIIINPAALTHTSVALRDALTGVGIPFVEIHITNVHSREAFRHVSFLSEKAEAVIMGMGVFGYQCAIDYAAKKMSVKKPESKI